MRPEKHEKKISIVLTGGGTGGSVTPLLAVYERLLKTHKSARFYWVGSGNGVEKDMISSANITYLSVPAGKYRRYFSLQNLADVFLIIAGLFTSFFKLMRIKPAVIISAGSFISVPVVWAGWMLRIPCLIHQQDARPGLANRLMAPFADMITVTFESSLKQYGRKAVLVGNFIRQDIKLDKFSQKQARLRLNLKPEKPTMLVLGGGTGAEFINKLVEQSLEELLLFCQVIHLTGKGKTPARKSTGGYQAYEFLHVDGMIKAFSAADIAVTRAGMAVLSELSYLGIPSVIIPIPDSHQEDNAEVFRRKKAAIVLDQKSVSPKKFSQSVKNLVLDKNTMADFRRKMKKIIKTDADKRITDIISKLIK